MDSPRADEQPGPTPPERDVSRVTRLDILDYLRTAAASWHGRLGEIEFLDGLYDLDALASTDSRYATARQDIRQHRVNNCDGKEDWVFDDPRFGLLDGPDDVLMAFLARMLHPEVQPDVDAAARLAEDLNRFLAPDGWALRADRFLSGRPVYAPVTVPKNLLPAIALPLGHDDAGKLEMVLGLTHHLLDADGQGRACELVRASKLSLRQDGAYYHPIPGDNWTESTYEAVLTIGPGLVAEFTQELQDYVWGHLGAVLTQLDRGDVQSMVVEGALPPLPAVDHQWREPAAPPPTNQARRERAANEGYPVQDGLVFGSRAELVAYEVLTELQRECQPQNAIAIMPLASVRLRDAGVRSPDFTVLGNGRAVIIEVDGPHHYGPTRKADDEDRDRHWIRCGVPTLRIAAHHTEDPASLKARLREDLGRTIFQRR